MRNIDPGEAEYLDYEDTQMQDVTSKDGQGARSFFAVLSFLLAALLLAVFLNNPMNSLLRMFALLAAIAFGIIGFLMWERRKIHLLGDMSQAQISEQENEVMRAQDLTSFELLVQEALDSIPEEFHERMENLIVIVEDEPVREDLKQVDGEEGILLGLYHGVPLTVQGYQQPMLPERITIYQRNIERVCQGNPVCIREQVRQTVLHEVAHHFGMGHEEMPIWLR